MSHVDDGALHAYLDSEVTAAERAEIEAHLAGCATCCTRLGEEQALLQRAGELLGHALPPERARRARRWIVPLTWAATVVLAIGLGYSLRGSGAAPMVDQVASSAEAAEKTADPQRQPDVAARRDVTRDTARDTVIPEAAVGVVAIRDHAQTLRAASPRDAANVPAPAAALAAGESRAERSLAARRGRLVATEWPVIQRSSARDLLGTDPVGVPGLAVRQLRRSPENDGTILIEQAVDASTVIQLYQRRSTAGLEREADRYGNTERLARFVDGLRVEIAGPLSQDSLNRLLEQLKPLP